MLPDDLTPSSTNDGDDDRLRDLLDGTEDLHFPDEYDLFEEHLAQRSPADTEAAFTRLLQLRGREQISPVSFSLGRAAGSSQAPDTTPGTAIGGASNRMPDFMTAVPGEQGLHAQPEPSPDRDLNRPASPTSQDPSDGAQSQGYQDTEITRRAAQIDLRPLDAAQVSRVLADTELAWPVPDDLAEMLTYQRAEAHRLEVDLAHARKMAARALESTLRAEIHAEQVEEVAQRRAKNFLDSAVEEAQRRIEEAKQESDEIVRNAEDFARVLEETVDHLQRPGVKVEPVEAAVDHDMLHAVAERHQRLLAQGQRTARPPRSAQAPISSRLRWLGSVTTLMNSAQPVAFTRAFGVDPWQTGLASARNLAVADQPPPTEPADTIEVVLALRESNGWSHWTFTVHSPIRPLNTWNAHGHQQRRSGTGTGSGSGSGSGSGTGPRTRTHETALKLWRRRSKVAAHSTAHSLSHQARRLLLTVPLALIAVVILPTIWTR